jgi:hypothetical protein
VQILASALPGFRDLRGPLIAGYLWLVFAWLLFEPNVDYRPPNGVGAAAYDLLQEVGPIATAIAVSVAAYLVGAVSQALSVVVRTAWSKWERLPLWARGGGRASMLVEVDAIHKRGRGILAGAAVGDSTRKARMDELEERADGTRYEAERELDLPATLLIGERPALFAEVDRLRGEAELRVTVALPILSGIVLLAAKSTLWWLLASPLVLVLFIDGVRRDSDAKKIVADSIRLGRVPSSSIGRFSEWVDAIAASLEKAEARFADEQQAMAIAEATPPTIIRVEEEPDETPDAN